MLITSHPLAVYRPASTSRNSTNIDRRSGSIIPTQRPQPPIILHSLHQRIMIIPRPIRIPPPTRRNRIPNQRRINMVRRPISLRLIIRHHHRQIPREILIIEPRHPFHFQIVGDICRAGIMPVVAEIRHVIPPLRQTATVDILLELRRGHHVGAAGGIRRDGFEIDRRDMFRGVGMRHPVRRGGRATPRISLRIHLPRHTFLLQQIQNGRSAEIIRRR